MGEDSSCVYRVSIHDARRMNQQEPTTTKTSVIRNGAGMDRATGGTINDFWASRVDLHNDMAK